MKLFDFLPETELISEGKAFRKEFGVLIPKPVHFIGILVTIISLLVLQNERLGLFLTCFNIFLAFINPAFTSSPYNTARFRPFVILIFAGFTILTIFPSKYFIYFIIAGTVIFTLQYVIMALPVYFMDRKREEKCTVQINAELKSFSGEDISDIEEKLRQAKKPFSPDKLKDLSIRNFTSYSLAHTIKNCEYVYSYEGNDYRLVIPQKFSFIYENGASVSVSIDPDSPGDCFCNALMPYKHLSDAILFMCLFAAVTASMVFIIFLHFSR